MQNLTFQTRHYRTIVAEEAMQCLYLQRPTQISPEFGAQHCQSDKLLVEEFHFSFERNHKLIVFDNFDIDVHCTHSFHNYSEKAHTRTSLC